MIELNEKKEKILAFIKSLSKALIKGDSLKINYIVISGFIPCTDSELRMYLRELKAEQRIAEFSVTPYGQSVVVTP